MEDPFRGFLGSTSLRDWDWSIKHCPGSNSSMTHVDIRELLDVVGTVLLCLLAEGDEELHLVPRVQVSNVAPIGQRVHVEEDILTGLVLSLVGNKTILCRKES